MKIFSIILVSLYSLLTVISLPFFIQALNGLKRTLFIVLNFCTVVALLLNMIHEILFGLTTQEALDIINDLFSDAEKSFAFRVGDIVRQSVFLILGDFFDCFYYFVCLMMSFDIYKMICDPFGYREFSHWKNVGRILLGGSFVCLTLGSHNFLLMLIKIFYQSDDLLDSYGSGYRQAMHGSNIFNLVRIVIIKLIYSIAVFIISKKIKEKLVESERLHSSGQCNWTLYKNIYHFSLIPFWINFIRSFHEFIFALRPLMLLLDNFGNFNCSGKWYFRSDIIFCATLIVHVLSSFSYIIGLFIFFPKVRKNVFLY